MQMGTVVSRQRFPILVWFSFWALIGTSVAVEIWRDPQQLTQLNYLTWLASLAAYAAASSLICRFVPDQEHGHRAILLTVIQSISALVMVAAHSSGLAVGLLIMVAFQLGFLVSFRTGLLWVTTQTAVYAAILFPVVSNEALVWRTFGLAAYHVLALTSSHFWANESRTKRELMKTNAELRLSQELLASSSRLAERQRISRELHDLLGHDLTAVSLNLEVAQHLASGKVKEQVNKALELNRKLLEDVREAVSTMRQDTTIDLKEILGGLVEGIQQPRIHVAFPENLELTDPLRAHTLLRCAQEIVTNSIRHAAAANLWLEFQSTDDGVTLKARDDGRGAKDLQPGTGLQGMRERLEQIGGRLQFSSIPSQGFHVEAWVPLREAVT